VPEIEIEYGTADWATALDPKYRYIFIKGGRSSGKSHEVANYLVERSITETDMNIVGLREIQKSIDKSSKSLVDIKIKNMGLAGQYKSIKSEIRKLLPSDVGHFYFQGMNDLTADNIKSLEDYKIAWFEEAQNCSRNTLKTLRPTIRAKGSQLIFTWNPKFPEDAIDEFCNQVRDEPDVLVIHVNYTDNPFLTDEVLREVELDKKNNPEDFGHIWLGEYDTSFHGHYYAKLLEDAKEDGRITAVPKKPGVDIIAAWDLGRSDATAIWVAQIVGREVRVIDHIEDNFKELDYYADWVKDNNYNGFNFLPHDAKHHRLGMRGSIKDQLQTYGLKNLNVMPALSKDAGRRLAKSLIKEAFIDQSKCKDGLQALRHEKAERDEKTGRYKEIHEHDSAAAFRYLAQALERYSPKKKPKPQEYTAPSYGTSTSWMG
jgi:phage terminase large subunit